MLVVRAPDSDISGVERLSLETTPQASMIIDIDAARIVDANSAAASLLTGRQTLPDGGLPLDRGTPALTAIERHLIQHDGAPAPVSELLFWTEGGTVLMEARCVPLNGEAKGLRRLVRVTAVDRAGGRRLEPEQQSPGIDTSDDSALAIVQRARLASARATTSPAGLGSPGIHEPMATPQRDDAMTLREIARRIRLGAGANGSAPAVEAGSEFDAKATDRFDPSDTNAAVVEIVKPGQAPQPPASISDTDTQADAVPASANAEVPNLLDAAGEAFPPTGEPRTGADTAPVGQPEQSSYEEQPPGATITIGQSGEIELAKLAHELRTPLAAIVGLAEIMRDERVGAMGNSRYRGYAADIYDSAQHAISLLTSTVEQIASPRGEMRLEITDVDANALIASCVSSMRPLADRAGIKLTASLAARLPRIRADERTMKQILLNLLSNALRHTPLGGEISVASAHRLAGEVQIVVRDNGSGMESSEIDRALAGSDEPLPRRSPSGSTGFGLPLVRRLVLSNGARLAIESVQGTGTRVSVTFGADRTVPV